MIDPVETLKAAVKIGASDIHFRTGMAPSMRVGGVIIPYTEENRASMNDITALTKGIMGKPQRDRYTKYGEVTFSTTIMDAGRFRISCFKTRQGMGVVLRPIPAKVPTLEELALPDTIKTMTLEKRGIIFVTGSSGSGKSSTAAAMLDHVNNTRPGHIVTIESPSEHVFSGNLCLIDQREVGLDTASIQSALKHALVEDPDIVMVGEVSDHETAKAILQVAEAGPLVIAQANTSDAYDTVMSFLNYYPAYLHRQTRQRLSTLLKGIISQRLIPSTFGRKRVPAVEILISTPRIQEYIRDEEKFKELNVAITESGPAFGMRSFDQSLLELYRNNEITYEDALRNCSDIQYFREAEAEATEDSTTRPLNIDPAYADKLPEELKEGLEDIYTALWDIAGESEPTPALETKLEEMKKRITFVSELAGGEKKNFQKNLTVISRTLDDMRTKDMTVEKAQLIAQGLHIVLESWELD